MKKVNVTKRKFCVYDEEKKKMYKSDKICRIHIQEGIPYCVILWSGETLMKTSNTKGFILYLEEDS